jgi:hypothetical protein
VVGKIKFLYNNKSFTEVTLIHQSSNITYIPTKMCDYEEQVVQCPYNKFHMCLLGRMNKHMWKCHPMEYTRDLDIKLDKKLAQQHQQRLQQQKPQQDLWHPQQTDVAEESWDNDNYPTYVPKKRTYGRQQQQQQQSQLQSEVEEESWNKDDYPTQQQQQSEVQEESWDKDDYPTQQQQSEVQEESWDKDDYPTQQQQQQQSQPQTEVEDDSWDMDDYPTYVSHNHYRNSF